MTSVHDARTCSFEGCNRPHKGLGLCSTHYVQQIKGRPLKAIRPMLPRGMPPARCSVPECVNPRDTAGFCGGHYYRHVRGLPLTGKLPSRAGPPRLCDFPDCGRKHSAKGLCYTHIRHQREGKPLRDLGPRPDATVRTFWLDQNGYRNGTYDGRIMMEHRVVMAEHIGRPLIGKENVHHINGQRADNRIENLELWSTSQPPGQRVADKTAWAKEWLAQYDPDSLAA